MEGLNILYTTEKVVGHGFNLLAFWIGLAAFVILGFGIAIPSFIHETGNVKRGVLWGCFCGICITIFGALISMLISTIADPIYATHYHCTIDYNIIDQEEFESTYEIVEQKDRMYIIRLRNK